jgi:hypothetical protein
MRGRVTKKKKRKRLALTIPALPNRNKGWREGTIWLPPRKTKNQKRGRVI